jgi:hypothetical protein
MFETMAYKETEENHVSVSTGNHVIAFEKSKVTGIPVRMAHEDLVVSDGYRSISAMLEQLQRNLKRQTFYIEIASSVTTLSFCVYALIFIQQALSNDVYERMTALVPGLSFAYIGAAVGLLQFVSALTDWRMFRWGSAILASWFWFGVAFLIVSSPQEATFLAMPCFGWGLSNLIPIVRLLDPFELSLIAKCK